MDCEEESKVAGTDGGSVQHLGDRALSSSPADNQKDGGDGDRVVDSEPDNSVITNKRELIDNNGNGKPRYTLYEGETEEKLSHVQRVGVRNDFDSDQSTFSEGNSEISEREITLDPYSADESTSLTEARALSAEIPENEQTREIMLTEEASSVSETAVGASEEREDISDEELELDSLGNVERTEPQVQAALRELEQEVGFTRALDESSKELEAPAEGALPPVHSDMSYNDNDVSGGPSSNEREESGLKFGEAAGKSDPGGQMDDLGKQMKGSIEDLETVSDDELPETAQPHVPAAAPATFNLIEGGEDVSSSEDEGPVSTSSALQPDRVTSGHSLDASEFPYGNSSSSDLALKADEVLSSHLSSEPSLAAPLAPLEAEPISDEEDLGHGEVSPGDVEGGEAGEIRSPVDIGSPASVPGQAGLLGGVEPISADESSDTDGELPSGDEDIVAKTESEAVLSSSNNFLESIDSEEEGDLGVDMYRKHLSSDNRHSSAISSGPVPKQNHGEYMETISDDDENVYVGGNATKAPSARESSQRVVEEAHTGASPAIKEPETRQLTANFSEHQEELDYEENEGDDGEGRPEEAVGGTEDIKEAGELAEDAGSDKDEGELSDDDCEEGEIKEPGSKKPFVKPMCRFFQRGICSWGVNCRFLHPGINDKGNYQMIEIPGFKPAGVRSRIGTPGTWPEQPEEQVELLPPPVPDLPPVETAWERGLRIAKEQRKKASERKELEADFEDKRLNLSVDEERELNKENERMQKVIPKDPYYDQFEEDDYYGIPRDPWQPSRYENFEVRYNRENSFSPPYREKPPMLPPPRFTHPYSPPVDKFGRDRVDRREPFRPEPPPVPHEYPSPLKRPDEWTDPWRRSKSPQNQKRRLRSRSRGRRTHRSVSDSSNSSRSSSGSSSGSSRSSRSFNSSTGSSSRSRSPEPAPLGVDRHDRYISPSRDQPRSTVSIRGPGGYNNFDQNYRRSGRGYEQNRGTNAYNQRGGNRGGSSSGGFYNNYGNVSAPPPGGYPERDNRDRARDERVGRNRARSSPDRPLPYVRPRPKSASSRSSSSRSHSRSRGRATSSRSRSRSSSGSSRSSSSSSSSAGSADSEHLYRDLGSPSKNPRGAASTQKRKRTSSYRDHSSGKGPQVPGQQGSQRRPGPPTQPPVNLDHIPHPRDPKPPLPAPTSGRPESKYASRNVPQAPVKAKDPLKVVGQKSNIKLTLLPKQQQSSLGSRPNPLDSPPHNKRRLSDRDTSPVPAPPPKRMNLPAQVQSSALRIAIEKAAKIQMRQEKGKSPPPPSLPQSLPTPSSSSSSSVPRAKAPVSPQKLPNSIKSRAPEPAVAKTVPKVPTANAPTATATGTKVKKSMSSRREELLKQLKAVEDAIARKKSKLQ